MEVGITYLTMENAFILKNIYLSAEIQQSGGEAMKQHPRTCLGLGRVLTGALKLLTMTC